MGETYMRLLQHQWGIIRKKENMLFSVEDYHQTD